MNSRNKRDIFIDTLRGLMLVIMTLDHAPLLIKRYTFSTFGFFGAAMGFIFLSGYVFGFVYSKHLDTPGYLIKKTYKRIWLIYKYHIGTFIIVLLLNFLFINFFNKGPINDELIGVYDNPGKLLKFVFLLEQPLFFDILPLYIAFLFVSPFVLIGFKKGLAGIILSTSFMVWLIFQIPDAQEFYDKIQLNLNINLGLFNLFAWQFLFVTGQFFGYNKNRSVQIIQYNKQTLWFFSILAIVILLVRQIGESKGWDIVHKFVYERDNLWGPRLVSFFVIIYLIGSVSKHLKVRNINYLAFLGQYSIDVFSFHIPLAYLMFKDSEIISDLSIPIQILIAYFLIACLGIPVIVRKELKLNLKKNRKSRLLKNMSLFFLFPKDLVNAFVENKIKRKL